MKWTEVNIEMLEECFNKESELRGLSACHYVDDVMILLVNGTIEQAQDINSAFSLYIQTKIDGIHWERLFALAVITPEPITDFEKSEFESDKFGSNKFVIERENDLQFVALLHKQWIEAVQVQLKQHEEESIKLLLQHKIYYTNKV